MVVLERNFLGHTFQTCLQRCGRASGSSGGATWRSWPSGSSASERGIPSGRTSLPFGSALSQRQEDGLSITADEHRDHVSVVQHNQAGCWISSNVMADAAASDPRCSLSLSDLAFINQDGNLLRDPCHLITQQSPQRVHGHQNVTAEQRRL